MYKVYVGVQKVNKMVTLVYGTDQLVGQKVNNQARFVAM